MKYFVKKWIKKNLSILKENKFRIIFPDKDEFLIGQGADEVIIDFLSWKTFMLLYWNGTIGFAEGYFKGYWKTNNLLKLLLYLAQNFNEKTSLTRGSKISNFYNLIRHRGRENSLEGSKSNILSHYDLGNNFYELWLDSTMTYSSALFKNECSLREAQENKYQSMLDFLSLEEGSSILEIGCGWGGFMEFAARKGYKVTGITISDSQFEFVKERIKNLPNNPEVILKDYRLLEGEYDGIVSIEMFEAVGSKYWKTYFDQINKLLRSNGKAVVQTITIKDNYLEDYQKNPDFIQTYIFPGGELASPSVFIEKAKSSSLTLRDSIEFSESYGRTLQIWHDKFNDAWVEISKLGFKEDFKKLWEFYFAYCRAGFLTDSLEVIQFSLEKNSLIKSDSENNY